MSDGKNLFLGGIGKIKSFFSAEYGPTIGAAMGLFIVPAFGALSGLWKPALTG